MTRPRPLPAAARFAAATRARVRRRARRVRLAIALLAPALLSSCVTVPLAHGVARPALAPTKQTASVSSATALPPDVQVEPLSGPSLVAGLGQTDRMRATLCLASAIYYEAATEPDDGQRAVAQVVLNRVRHPAWPHSVCGVVYQGSSAPGCQFSFACDGAMARAPMLSAWIRARRAAENALAGEVYAPVGSATFYHTLRVAPAWRLRMVPVAIVGAHIFYRQPGDAPDAAALPISYRGNEPTPGPLPRVVPPAELLRVAADAVLTPLPLPLPVAFAPAPVAPHPKPLREDDRYIPGALPDSSIRPEFRDSGKWIGG